MAIESGNCGEVCSHVDELECELTHAEGFVVSFCKVSTTGFVIEGKDAINKQGLVYERIQELIAEKRCEQKLVSIFSGVFSMATDEIATEDSNGEAYVITCGAGHDADDEEQSFAQHQKQRDHKVRSENHKINKD